MNNARSELPEGFIIRCLLPAAQECSGKVTSVRRMPDQINGRGAALLRALLRETCSCDERGWQPVDRGNRAAERARHARMPDHGIRVEGVTRQEFIDDRTRSVEWSLAYELWHVERKPTAIASGERAEGHKVCRLLGLGRLLPGNADDELSAVAPNEQGRVEKPVGAATVRANLCYVESRNGGSGQRG